MTAAVADREHLDTTALVTWLDQQEFGAGAPLEHRFLSGGAQNVIFALQRGDWTAALRMPPPSAPDQRDDGMQREWRIISALNGSDVPHTAAIAFCGDPSVLGRPFYLMGLVDGWSPMSLQDQQWPEPFQSDLEQRAGLGYALVEGIAAMAAFDWRPHLSDLGRPHGFHDRQVARWEAMLAKVRTRDLAGADVAAAWLRERRPLDFVPGLMHGDYQFSNVMFRHGGPARLAAILDWEMGTVGDPKMDLAWGLAFWPDAQGRSAAAYVDLTGLPERETLVQHFAERTGRQVDDMDYYDVLVRWKLAIVLEQGWRTATPDSPRASFGPVVLTLMAQAAEIAESSTYRRSF